MTIIQKIFGTLLVYPYFCGVRMPSEGANLFAFIAIFKLDLSDYYAEDIAHRGYVLSFSITSFIICLIVSLSEALNASDLTTTAFLL